MNNENLDFLLWNSDYTELKLLYFSTDPEQYEIKIKELAAKEKELREAMKKDMSTPPEPKPDKDTDTGISGPVSWPPKVHDICCCLSPLPSEFNCDTLLSGLQREKFSFIFPFVVLLGSSEGHCTSLLS